MPRFLLFGRRISDQDPAHGECRAGGGWHDFINAYEDYGEAILEGSSGYRWWHVVDLGGLVITAEG